MVKLHVNCKFCLKSVCLHEFFSVFGRFCVVLLDGSSSHKGMPQLSWSIWASYSSIWTRKISEKSKIPGISLFTFAGPLMRSCIENSSTLRFSIDLVSRISDFFEISCYFWFQKINRRNFCLQREEGWRFLARQVCRPKCFTWANKFGTIHGGVLPNFFLAQTDHESWGMGLLASVVF